MTEVQDYTQSSGTVSETSDTKTTYDAYGNVTEEQTPEGTIYHNYDPATGEETQTSTGDTNTLYTYNPQGELTSATVTELNGTTLSTPNTGDRCTYDGPAACPRPLECLHQHFVSRTTTPPTPIAGQMGTQKKRCGFR